MIIIKYKSLLYAIGASLSDALTTYAGIDYFGIKEGSPLRFKTIIDSSNNLGQNLLAGELVTYPIFYIGSPLFLRKMSEKFKDGIEKKKFGYKIMEKVVNKINSNKYLKNISIDDACLYLWGTFRLAATFNNLILILLSCK